MAAGGRRAADAGLADAGAVRPAWLAAQPGADASDRGLRLALCALAVAVGFGVALVLLLGGRVALPLGPLLDNHVLWAALGWLLLLLLSVARTVIPMFLVTPPPAADGYRGRRCCSACCAWAASR